MRISKKNLLLLSFVALMIASFFYFRLDQYLSFEYLKSQQAVFQDYYDKNPVLCLGLYFLIYVVTTALSLPGATVLTLLGGALFGFVIGLVVVSFASTLGATLAFLFARFLLRDSLNKKFGDRLQKFNEGIKKEGLFYLFTLRLIPILPFFVINLVMGLTPIKSLHFFIVSQIGMLAGTAVYVNAGTRLGELESIKGILSPALILSFALLGLFPLIAKKTITYFKTKKETSL